MTRLEIQIQLALAEVAQSQLRARHFDLRIQTGAWRDRVGHVFIGPMSDRVLASEEQVLASEVSTHDSHIQRAEELLGYVKQLLAKVPMESERG